MVRRCMVIIGLLSLGSTAALAGPFYVGASAGKTDLEVDNLNTSFDGSDTTYKAFVGYRFLKFFGIEGGFVDLGSPEDTSGGIDISVDATAYDLFAVGVLPIGGHFELFAKAGYFSWDREETASGPGGGTESETGSDAVYGVGAAFIFGKHIGLRLEYEEFNMSDVDSLSQTSAGIDIRL